MCLPDVFTGPAADRVCSDKNKKEDPVGGTAEQIGPALSVLVCIWV
jgi:hypothetical protein